MFNPNKKIHREEPRSFGEQDLIHSQPLMINNEEMLAQQIVHRYLHAKENRNPGQDNMDLDIQNIEGNRDFSMVCSDLLNRNVIITENVVLALANIASTKVIQIFKSQIPEVFDKVNEEIQVDQIIARLQKTTKLPHFFNRITEDIDNHRATFSQLSSYIIVKNFAVTPEVLRSLYNKAKPSTKRIFEQKIPELVATPMEVESNNSRKKRTYEDFS